MTISPLSWKRLTKNENLRPDIRWKYNYMSVSVCNNSTLGVHTLHNNNNYSNSNWNISFSCPTSSNGDTLLVISIHFTQQTCHIIPFSYNTYIYESETSNTEVPGIKNYFKHHTPENQKILQTLYSWVSKITSNVILQRIKNYFKQHTPENQNLLQTLS